LLKKVSLLVFHFLFSTPTVVLHDELMALTLTAGVIPVGLLLTVSRRYFYDYVSL